MLAMRSILLLLLCCQQAKAFVQGWNINVSTTGAFTLTSFSGAAIKNTCPSFKTSHSKALLISLCDTKYYQSSPNVTTTSNTTSTGELGTYTDHTIQYVATNKTYPNVMVVVRKFSIGTVVHIQLQFHSPVPTNYIATLSGEGTTWTLGDAAHMAKPRILDVPIDNNVESMYSIRKAGFLDALTFGTSAYVSAFFDESTRRGIVLGFLEHDLWKTGIRYFAGRYDARSFEAVAGINGWLDTRDYSMPHGTVLACTKSPWLSVALHDDWRDGMNQYARTLKGGNGKPAPVPVHSGLPTSVFNNNIAGFNSWGLHENPNDINRDGNLSNLIAASNVLSKLKVNGFGSAPNSQWINQDADADLSTSDFNTFVDNVYSQNQFDGSYTCPFVHFGRNTSDTCSCGGTTWPLKEVLLKDTLGHPIVPLAGKLANGHIYGIDATHPYSNCHIVETIESILSQGTTSKHLKRPQLLKVDFIDYAAIEAVHYNSSLASTGMAAYNLALHQVFEAVNGRMLIDLSMSLALPHQYAHSRRIGCDQMYGGVEYSMNQQTGGFWLNELYRWLDPDLIALSGADADIIPGVPDKLLAMDAKSRVAKAVVVGGLFLNGDDLSNQTNVALAKKYLGNSRVNSMWNRTRVQQVETRFRTSNNSEGWWIFAAHVFVRATGSGKGDLALFNYEPFERLFSVDLREIKYNSSALKTECVEIWEDTALKTTSGNVQTFSVPARSSFLIECSWE